MPMESLIEGLKSDLATFRAALDKAYACTCDWSASEDQHNDNCPKELRLRDIEASR
jgi:hypothetical protein